MHNQIATKILAVLFLCVTLDIHAQSGIPKDGFTPEHDYSQSAIDSVDLDSGNLIINIPIISYKQRGSLPDFTLKARYNATNWALVDDQQNVYNPAWNIQVPSQFDQVNVQNFPTWNFFGGGVQIVRGDALTKGTINMGYTEDSGEPGTYTQTYVEDGNGTQHLLYFLENSQKTLAMDGSGIAASTSDIRSSLTKLIDANGAKHSGIDDGAADGFCDSVSDPFGNTITAAGCVVATGWPSAVWWNDSVGRQIPAPPSSPYGYIPPGCYPYQFPATTTTSNSTAQYTFCYSKVFVRSAFGRPNTTEGGGTFSFLTSIQLPNGTSYTFAYDSWGEINRIGLPDGGSVTYTWVTAGGQGSYGARTLQARTVDPGDGTPVRTWMYCSGSLSGCDAPAGGGTVVKDPYGNETVRYNIYQSNNVPAKATITYQGAASNGIVLKTVLQKFCSSGGYVFFRVAIQEPSLPCETDTTLSDGETFSQTTTYDTPVLVGDPIASSNFNSDGRSMSSTAYRSIGLPTVQTVSSFGVTAPGPTLKTTNTQYLWQNDSRYLQANFLELPSTVTITDGLGNLATSTSFGYDENNGSPQGVYGQRTSVNSGLGTAVTTTSVYNGQGMVTDTYDGNSNAGLLGNHVNITYDSTGLFPSKVTQSTTAGVAHIDYYSYDTNTGNLNWHTDQNGSAAMDANHTTFWSYDNMGRTTSVTNPDGGGSNYCYTDVGGATCSSNSAPYSAYLTTRLSASSVMTSSVSFDGLGETVKKIGPNGAVTDISYDLAGRVHSISNPYYSQSDTTYGVTTTTYDALGPP